MPLLLDTPLDMGAVDSDYTHIRIMTFFKAGDYIQITVQHGTMDGSNFIPGMVISGITDKKFTIEGSEYTTIVSTLTSDVGVPVYNEVTNALYQWLISKGHYAGTII